MGSILGPAHHSTGLYPVCNLVGSWPCSPSGPRPEWTGPQAPRSFTKIILYWIRNVINRTGRYHHGNFFNANMMNRDTDLPAPEYGRAKTSSSLNQGRSGRSGLYSSSPPFRIRSVPSLEQDHFIEAVSPVQWGQIFWVNFVSFCCILSCWIFF